jgi:hypothetical protein
VSPARGVIRQAAALAGRSNSVRVRCATRDVHPPAAELKEEEHIQASEPERLDGEKVAGDDRVGVRTQEVAPAELGASACRRDARLPQDLGDRCCRDAYADTGEFTDDPLVAQRGFSRASRGTSSRISSAIAGRPGRRPAYVQRFRTSWRCPWASEARFAV